MREFEKWWQSEQTMGQVSKDLNDPQTEEQLVDALAEYVWKAAVEFALKIASENQDDGTWHMLLDELEEE